jgi:uncharacterized repeat protein (TIGR03803 family)
LNGRPSKAEAQNNNLNTSEANIKTLIENLFLLPVLIAGLGWTSAVRVTAQSLTVLHHFDLYNDGGNPSVTEALTFSGDMLYGATYDGGPNGVDGGTGRGTVFAVRTDGTGFRVIHSFSPRNADGTNVDGETPYCTLKFAGNRLYGTATSGGTSGNGVLFSVNADGTDFATLFNFSGAPLNSSYGKHSPVGSLTLAGETLYGVTARGGSAEYDGSVNGRVYAVNVNGGGTALYAFPPVTWDGDHLYTPYGPVGGVVLLGGKLYGVTISGGYDDYGTIFTVNLDGSGYSTLHYFTEDDGANPMAALVSSGNTLYGSTMYGGSQGRGVIFAINSDGLNFTVLHHFTDSEGYGCQSSLLVSGDIVYGSTLGGSTGFGTVFSMKADGTVYRVLHSFEGHAEGIAPGGLIQAGADLYGMTAAGGSFDYGTIFRLTLPAPELAIVRSAPNVVLTWPTNEAGFILESTTNPASAGFWSPVAPAAVVVNGQNTVTNPVIGAQRLYRLTQQPTMELRIDRLWR